MEINCEKDLIIIKPDNIKKSNTGTISGVIYFDFGEYNFPEIGWNDNIIVIIGWWLEAIIRLSNRLTKIEDLKFMDGPLRVKLTINNNLSCVIECINDGKGSVIEYSKTISIDSLLSSVIHVGHSILSICKANNWDSDDVYLLKKLIKILESKNVNLFKE